MASRSQSKVYFFSEGVKVTLNKRTDLKRFIDRMFRKEGKVLGSLNIIFVSDKELLDINRRFLRHDYFTDIITFNTSDTDEAMSGELYISVDRVRDNALKLKIPYSTELRRVIFHGILHLCGYKDKTASQTKTIRAKENQYLEMFKNSFT